MATRTKLFIALWTASSVSAAFAQVAISTAPGLLHYAEGQVFLDEDKVEFGPAQFATLKSGQRFRVGDGRAELLLSPRALLWMGKDSELEFLSDDLLSIRVRLHQGSAVIQVIGYSGVEEAEPLSVVCERNGSATARQRPLSLRLHARVGEPAVDGASWQRHHPERPENLRSSQETIRVP